MEQSYLIRQVDIYTISDFWLNLHLKNTANLQSRLLLLCVQYSKGFYYGIVRHSMVFCWTHHYLISSYYCQGLWPLWVTRIIPLCKVCSPILIVFIYKATLQIACIVQDWFSEYQFEVIHLLLLLQLLNNNI